MMIHTFSIKLPLRSTALIVFCLLPIFAFQACQNKPADAKTAVEEYLKAKGMSDVKEVKVDYFLIDPSSSDKAYVAVTTIYSFATAEGKLQSEYTGYILKKEGNQWKVEKNTSYTKEQEKAVAYLAGQKI